MGVHDLRDEIWATAVICEILCTLLRWGSICFDVRGLQLHGGVRGLMPPPANVDQCIAVGWEPEGLAPADAIVRVREFEEHEGGEERTGKGKVGGTESRARR